MRSIKYSLTHNIIFLFLIATNDCLSTDFNQIKIKSIAKVDLFNDPHKLKTALFYEYESTGKKTLPSNIFTTKLLKNLLTRIR